MKLSIFSFGTNSRVAAKFQTDRFRTFGENREEKKTKKKEITASKPYTLPAATLRSAVPGSVNKILELRIVIVLGARRPILYSTILEL